MANVMLEILDGFFQYESLFLQVTWILNLNKWILVADIITQILLTILL